MVCEVRLYNVDRTSLSISARMIGMGKEKMILRTLIQKVLNSTRKKNGSRNSQRKCSKSFQGLAMMPR